MRLDIDSSNLPAAMSTRAFALLLGLIVALSIAVRAAVGLTIGPTLESLPDQAEYLQAADAFAQSRVFSIFDPRVNDTVYAQRLPGYPAFVWLLGRSPTLVRLTQAVLDGSTVLATGLLASRLLSRRLALLAAAIVAVHPYLIYFSATLLSETLFTTMLAWAMCLLIFDGHHERTTWRWWLAIVLLLLSIYVRPSAIGLPLLLGMATLFHRPLTLLRLRLPVGFTLGLLTLATLLPWAIRNQGLLHHWIWTSTNTGITLYDGLNPDATGASDQRFVTQMPQLQTMSETDRSSYLGNLAWRFAREHSFRTAQLSGAKIARMWSPVPLSEASQRGAIVAASTLFCVPFFVMILIGLSRKALPRQIVLVLIAPAVYFTLMHAISVGSIRYRVPADVPLAIVAAAAFSQVSRRPVL